MSERSHFVRLALWVMAFACVGEVAAVRAEESGPFAPACSAAAFRTLDFWAGRWTSRSLSDGSAYIGFGVHR